MPVSVQDMWLDFQNLMVIIHTACLNTVTLQFVRTVCLIIVYSSHKKRQLFPYTRPIFFF